MTTMTESNSKRGQAIYTPWSLKFYNLWVVNFSNRFIWRCPKHKIQALYDENVSAKHLDIGVGTAYFLKNCQWPKDVKLSLMDVNTHSLNLANQKMKHLNPIRYQADIYKPQTFLKDLFQSISMSYLLHCLAGDMRAKTTAIRHAVDMLEPGGRLFGATIISDDSKHTVFSRKLMNFYNSKEIFSNEFDSERALRHALKGLLENLKIETHGCVALFSGNKSKHC